MRQPNDAVPIFGQLKKAVPIRTAFYQKHPVHYFIMTQKSTPISDSFCF
ncbi:Hypothetical protein I595_521 [Croceitalea dokdonensis DOKDO 023]|uniref:Uncharacterized protein n=1 Tax=Croceitalea dokdonensis DOKDO 023 TaxID=1300341 RepID=A0A0P7A9Q7_9FLAO|nr:Hypothetical protein I595_521 [Croceitalea dokdonensis DOKDO 023]